MTDFQKVCPTLTGGVSQQPAGSRSPSQVSECINGHLSLTDGNAKRPPSITVGDAALIQDLQDNHAIHVIERDGSDYVVILRDTDALNVSGAQTGVNVFNATTGDAMTVVPNSLVDTVDRGYNGNSPGNHVVDWELPGIADTWPVDGGAPLSADLVTLTGPALENFPTPTQVVDLNVDTAGAANDNQVATSVYTRFHDRITYASVYVKELDSLEHFGLRLYNSTQGVWYSKFFEWDMGAPALADGPTGGPTADTRVNDANPGDVLIEGPDANDWYRITYYIDVAETTDVNVGWPVAGDQISSFQILIADTSAGAGDYFYGAAVGHVVGDMPTAAPPIESAFGPFRFLTIADATFIANTSWETRVTRDGTDSRESWLKDIGSVPESTVKITLTSMQANANYDYSISNGAGGSPFAGSVQAGYAAQTPGGAANEPWGWKNLAQEIADAITAEDPSLTATLEGDRTIIVDSTSPVTACTVSAGRMVSAITQEVDTLYVIAVEPPSADDTCTWSITNDDGEHTAAPAILAADTTTLMASKLASSITAAHASLTATATSEDIVITSTSPITAFSQYMTTEQGASNPDAYGRYSMFKEQVTDVAYISVVQGVADSDYTWELKSTAGTFSGTHTVATSGNTETIEIATQIAADIQAADITLEGTAAFGSVVEVRSTVPIDNFKTNDTQAENLMVAFTTEVESIVDLPLFFRDGYVVKISTDPTTEAENQFVRFETTGGESGFGIGQWIESTDWGEGKYFDESSMPHKLQLLYDDEAGTETGTAFEPYFEYGPQEWTPRAAGDDETNPEPSFAGGKLNAIHFASNRLGFLEDQNCIQSETALYFNFWRTTLSALPDTDPIDVSANEPEIAVLHTAHTLGEQLIVTSTAGQFVLSGDPPTPATAFLRKVTSYRFQNLEPAPSGRSLYYSVPGPQDTTIVEFTRVTEGFQTEEVTRAAPSYIKGSAEWLVALPSANFLAVKAAAANKLYVYKYNWRGDQKDQSAWATWTFDAGCELLHLHFLETRAVLMVRRDGDLYLATFTLADSLEEGGNEYQVHLDGRLTQDQCTELPDTPSPGTTRVYWAPAFETGTTILLTDTEGNTIASTTSDTVQIELDSADLPAEYYVGAAYTHSVELSPPIPQSQDRLTGAYYPRAGRFNPVTLQVQVAETGEFTAAIAPGCVTATYTMSFDHEDYCDAADLLDGYFQVPVMGSDADGLAVTLSNDSALPSRFTSAIWRGDLAPRGIL